MRKKNKIEQELDQKEFENDLGKDLNLEYQKIDNHESLLRDKNKYVIAAINFFGTLFFPLVIYIGFKFLVRYFTAGYGSGIFTILDPLVYGVLLSLAIIAVVKKKSPLDYLLQRFG